MKALNLRQPWAEMIANGQKTIETRMWKTKHIGPLLIVASKTKPDIVPAYRPVRTLKFGQAIAICILVKCRPMTDADETAACCPNEPGRFAWVLDGIGKIQPFPVKGQLGLYNVDYDWRKKHTTDFFATQLIETPMSGTLPLPADEYSHETERTEG